MRNLAAMMQKAKAVQENITAMKDALTDMRFEGTSGGGAVRAVINGRGEMCDITLNLGMLPGVGAKGAGAEGGRAENMTAENVAMLEDLIVVATNAARTKAEAVRREKMAEITGGLPLPPGFDALF